MGMLSDLVSSGQSIFSGNASKPDNKETTSTLYAIQTGNWYQSFPYAFKAQRGQDNYIFYLPINPQNINIVTHFATNIVATLYGTVEEHSEQRYFDITIAGTTGFSPKYIDEKVMLSFDIFPSETNKPGRKHYSQFSISSMLGGFFPKTAGKVDNAINQATSTFKTITGSSTFKSGIYNDTSGYAAFHNFYQFLLRYKANAASGSSPNNQNTETMSPAVAADAPLIFLNFKDNNQYSCAIQRFTLTRSADNPMLYNYSIQMRAYDLRSIVGDRPKELGNRYKDLGLDTSMSIAAKAKLAISGGKTFISSAKGALKGLGG